MNAVSDLVEGREVSTTLELTMGGAYVHEAVFCDSELADVTPGWGDTAQAARAALLENLEEYLNA